MPDHIINKLYMKGSNKDVYKCREFLYNGGNNQADLLDFNCVIPMPEGYLDNGEWRDWSIKYWGTKWNAYETKSKYKCITFKTAWSSPCATFLILLSINFKDIKFILKSRSELPSFGNYWKKTLSLKNGQVLKVRETHKVTNK